MPQQQFDLLMKVLAAAADGSTVRISGADKNLLTPEVQQEFLNLQALLGSLAAGHEDRAAYVMVQLGDGEHIKGAATLVPLGVAAGPDKLRAFRGRLDAQHQQRTSECGPGHGTSGRDGAGPASETESQSAHPKITTNDRK